VKEKFTANPQEVSDLSGGLAFESHHAAQHGRKSENGIGKALERVTKRLFWRVGARSTRVQSMRASVPSGFRGNVGAGEQNESGVAADSTAGIMAGNAKPQQNACLQIGQDADARRNSGSGPTIG
jgi:hypothetical protein